MCVSVEVGGWWCAVILLNRRYQNSLHIETSVGSRRLLGTWENDPKKEAWAGDVCLGSSRSFIVKLKIRDTLVI